MVSSEVQRTLVKSPPELWAELSDPAALARHLGALGEIRITKVEPEQRVEWEGENLTGAVSIKASGWGTKVTISVTRELELSEVPPATGHDAASDAEPQPSTKLEPVPTATVDPAPAHRTDAEPSGRIEPTPAAEPTPTPEPTPKPEFVVAIATEEDAVEPFADEAVGETAPATAVEPELAPAPAAQPRRGFFARLFRRREPVAVAATEATEEVDGQAHVESDQANDAAVMAEPAPIAAPAPAAASEIVVPPDIAELLVNAVTAQASAARTGATAAGEPQPAVAEEPDASPPAVAATPSTAAEQTDEQPDAPAPAGTERDLAAELLAAEEVAEEEVTAVLTAVLDRLGAAHHRPFSRS
jgi:hypothetical protein